MLKIPNLIELPFKREHPVCNEDSDEDKFPESFPRYFIEQLSKPGAKIFDPFLGHGTTALVAEELDRVPYGIEVDPYRYEWCLQHIKNSKNIRFCDALDISKQKFPKMDLCVTSPPFMGRDHDWNPLYEGDPKFGSYKDYLKKMTLIFKAIKPVMKKNAKLCVHVDNVEQKVFTPLVRDFSICISEHFNPIGETIIQWNSAPETYPFTHCLIFKNTL